MVTTMGSERPIEETDLKSRAARNSTPFGGIEVDSLEHPEQATRQAVI